MTPDYAAIQASVAMRHLAIFGALHPTNADQLPIGTRTLLLLGPQEPGFWAHVTATPEFAEGAANPLDRWSERVITALANQLDGWPLFPIEKPYLPFPAWARESGRAWPSPVGLLVHDTAGLFISYRGAIALKSHIDIPHGGENPCLSCRAKPCVSACPVDAMQNNHYDVETCKNNLEKPENDCMARGCAIRRACPTSQVYGRIETQSAFHMAAFK